MLKVDGFCWEIGMLLEVDLGFLIDMLLEVDLGFLNVMLCLVDVVCILGIVLVVDEW